MSSRIHLVTSDEHRRCRLEAPGADHAGAAGHCPARRAAPFRVQGAGRHIAADDRAYDADALCVACMQRVGTLRFETNALFGLREDEAVFRAAVKIY